MAYTYTYTYTHPAPSDRNKRGTSKAQGRAVDDGNAQRSH